MVFQQHPHDSLASRRLYLYQQLRRASVRGVLGVAIVGPLDLAPWRRLFPELTIHRDPREAELMVALCRSGKELQRAISLAAQSPTGELILVLTRDSERLRELMPERLFHAGWSVAEMTDSVGINTRYMGGTDMTDRRLSHRELAVHCQRRGLL